MKFSETFTSKDSTKLDKETLLILRWIALSGQFFAIVLVKFIFNFKLELLLCLSIIAIGVLSVIFNILAILIPISDLKYIEMAKVCQGDIKLSWKILNLRFLNQFHVKIVKVLIIE